MNLKAVMIQLPRRSVSCHQCAAPLGPGSEYFSMLLGEELFEGKPNSIERQDFCLLCWHAKRLESPSPSLGFNWKSAVAKKILPKPGSQKKEEIALDLLRSAANPNQPLQSPEETFFLYLFLMHKRLLHLKKEIQHDGEKYLIVEIVDTEELLAIKNIDLRRVDINSLQAALSHKLGNEASVAS